MFPSDDISADLPARRDDEHPELRTDIVDELADHLECALQRERHRAGDEDGARKSVLRHFGNPTAIARKLWYDAMKDRIMNQRLTMAAAIVMACACLGMLGVVIQMRGDADEAARQREQLATLLADSQDLNRELVGTVAQQLSEMEARSAAETPDWNPVELRLVQGSEDGPPAVGFSVEMSITGSETGILPSTSESDETGIVRFERMRYGHYNLTVTAPWNESCRQGVLLQPGEGYAATIVCPMSRRATVSAIA